MQIAMIASSTKRALVISSCLLCLTHGSGCRSPICAQIQMLLEIRTVPL